MIIYKKRTPEEQELCEDEMHYKWKELGDGILHPKEIEEDEDE